MLSPETLLTRLRAGLSLVDQIRERALFLFGNHPLPVSARGNAAGWFGNKKSGRFLRRRIDPDSIQMTEWDAMRFEALIQRLRTNQKIYSDLMVSETVIPAAGEPRPRHDIRITREILYRDYRELQQLYELVLGASQPDLKQVPGFFRVI